MKNSILLLVLCPVVALSQGLRIDLGSDGSYGPLNITADTTLPLPPDGVFQVTTMTVAAGATLRFTPNARNTGVTIVAQSDVTIEGTVDVSGSPGLAGVAGAPGPGGGEGNTPTSVSGGRYPLSYFYTSPVLGRVGGYGGQASYGSGCTQLGAGGSGGGGAISIRSNTAIRGAGSVIAAGGAASPLLPTTPANPSLCTNRVAAQSGNDGNIRLISPVVSLPSATLVAAQVTIDRIVATGQPPTVRTSAMQPVVPMLSGIMEYFPAPVSTRIVSIDGTSVPTATDVFSYSFGPTATSTTIVTEVTGCRGLLYVQLNAAGFFSPMGTQASCTGPASNCSLNGPCTYTNVTGTVTTTFTCPIPASTFSTGAVRALATCTLP